MTVRAPLVIGPDGLPQQLQAGDTISLPTTTPSIRAVLNGEAAAALPIGTPVYASAPDTVKRGQANAKATSRIAGLVYDPTIAAGATGYLAQSGILIATAAQWDAVAGTSGGLAFGTYYFLDPAAGGKLTSVPPTTAGQCLALAGLALSATELELELGAPILL